MTTYWKWKKTVPMLGRIGSETVVPLGKDSDSFLVFVFFKTVHLPCDLISLLLGQ